VDILVGLGYSLLKAQSLISRYLTDIGAITMIIGAISWWMIIVDFPSEATFLTEEEREIVTRRLEADGQHGARAESYEWSYMRDSFTDWKTWT
jgi:hypothetical protein